MLLDIYSTETSLVSMPYLTLNNLKSFIYSVVLIGVVDTKLGFTLEPLKSSALIFKAEILIPSWFFRVILDLN